MNKEQVFETVKNVIAEQLDTKVDNVTMDTQFAKDLDADSLDIFEVIDKLEDEYDIEIETDEGMDTVGKLVDYIMASAK